MRVMLEQIRGERRLEDIAAELDVAVSTVQRWEKHSMAIPSFRLPDIARAYGCSVTDIFAEDDGTEEDADEARPASAEVVDFLKVAKRIAKERRLHALEVLSTFAK